MINEVYSVLLTIVNKENAGYVSPTEFNLLAANVQNEIFTEYFSGENRDKVRENKGFTNSGYSNLDFNTRQKIEQFASTVGVAKDGLTFPLPEDLYYIIDDGITATGGVIVEEVERTRFNYLSKSEVAPTELYPVYTRYSDNIKVSPSTIDAIFVEYLRKPTSPQWTYQVIEREDGSTIELYDPTNSSFQDFELHESEFSNIVLRLLTFFSINLREGEVAKIAEALKEKSFNKEVN